jgi:hypothetical protein
MSAGQKKSQKRHVLTEEKLDDIGAQLEASPKKLLFMSFGSSVGVGKCTAHTGTKFLKLWPYITTVVHGLLPPYCKVKI